MKKTLIFAVIALSLLFTLALVGVSAAQEGTAIYDKDGFLAMESGGTYYFANDIDLGGFVVRGYYWSEFSGTIDGNGYALTGFSIDGDNSEVGGDDCGLIKVIGTNGAFTIKNLKIGTADAPIIVTNARKNTGVIGGATKSGSANPVRITDVTIYAEISNDTSTSACNYSTFVGLVQGLDVLVENCKSYGKVTSGQPGHANRSAYANTTGFFAVVKAGKTVIKNCENYSDITAYYSMTEARAAGFVGWVEKELVLENCKNYGNISAYNFEQYHENPILRTFYSDSYVSAMIADTHASNSIITVTACDNSGTLFGTNMIGTMIGRVRGSFTSDGCSNSGNITSNALCCEGENAFYGKADGAALTDGAFNGTITNYVNIGQGVEFVPVTYTDPEPVDTTAPDADETTTVEEEETTAPDAEETTTAENVVTTTKKPDSTTAPTDDKTNEKSCGGFAGVAAVIAVAVSVIGVAIIKKH